MSEQEKFGAIAGSLDPITFGHIWLIERALELMDHVMVFIGDNPDKKYLFTAQERIALAEQSLKEMNIGHHRVTVQILPKNTFLVSQAYLSGCRHLIKGIRDTNDFVYEQKQQYVNSVLCPLVQTLYVTTPKKYSEVSSSLVKSIVTLDGSRELLRSYITPCVLHALEEKLC